MRISDRKKLLIGAVGFGLLEVPLRARHAAKTYCHFFFFRMPLQRQAAYTPQKIGRAHV